jgi:hypothetical protein
VPASVLGKSKADFVEVHARAGLAGHLAVDDEREDWVEIRRRGDLHAAFRAQLAVDGDDASHGVVELAEDHLLVFLRELFPLAKQLGDLGTLAQVRP